MNLPEEIKMTPMLEQYFEWKKRYPDCLLFFRMGDFYEMFFDDASIASSILDIALTARDPARKIPMAGVPFHSVESYLAKLVSSGRKVAICEQVSEPDGRNLVERQVVRVVTPGTFLPGESSAEGRIAAVAPQGNDISLALLNCASGVISAGTLSRETAKAELAGFCPKEIIAPQGFDEQARGLMPFGREYVFTPRRKEEFNPVDASRMICRRMGVSTLAGFGIEDLDQACGCAGVLYTYIEETQFRSPEGVLAFSPLQELSSMRIDPSSIENLEIVGEEGASLVGTLDRCRTPGGKRKLREWLLHPLLDPAEISRRQDRVSALVEASGSRAAITSSLSGCGDLDRAISRFAFGSGGPRDALTIRENLRILPRLKAALETAGIQDLLELDEGVGSLFDLLDKSLKDELPRIASGGELIREGFDEDIDSLRKMKKGENQWLVNFVEELKKETGIKNLKTGYNKVFGYYIEVPRSSASMVPDSFVRKQTLVSGERYVTEELKSFEERMISASDELVRREEKVFRDVCRFIVEMSSRLRCVASAMAAIDVFAAFAQISLMNRYCRPFVDHGDSIFIEGARHPVVESRMAGDVFTPNDISLDSGESRIAIVTGPNMAGKSTYLRTAALLVIMAQAGCFIPARSARLGVVEKVFSRIGARDEIARGRSTFMVEMIETANILNNVTAKSLVVLDEVGRGTSTYDGMSIAWAVLEYLQQHAGKRPKVLFATHFHELTALSETLPGVTNLSMAVEERDNGVIFLYKVVPVPADRSYGIEVARLAGIPEVVIERSRKILEGFEKRKAASMENGAEEGAEETGQLSLFGGAAEEIIDELAEMDTDSMTPFAALERLYLLREKAKGVRGKT